MGSGGERATEPDASWATNRRPELDLEPDLELNPEPEPEWADAIRRARQARGDRLREVFATFGEDDPATRAPRRRAPQEDDGS